MRKLRWLGSAGRYHQARPRLRSGTASVSPPWVGVPHAVPRESSIIRLLSSTQPGVASVSPRWFSEPHLQRQCARWSHSGSHSEDIPLGLTPPLLCTGARLPAQRDVNPRPVSFPTRGLTLPHFSAADQLSCRRKWALSTGAGSQNRCSWRCWAKPCGEWSSSAAGQVHSVASRALQRFQASWRALRSASGPFGSSPWRMKPWPAPG